jgi:hypothetical protein
MRILKVSVIPIASGARLLARPATAVLSTTVTGKKPSTASIVKPAAGVIVRVVVPRARFCASAGVPRPVSAPPQHGRQEDRADNTANELTDDIADRLADAHRAGGEHTDTDRGVKMPARLREGEGHDGQAVGERNRDDTGPAHTFADHGRRAGADEFRKELGAIRWDIVLS